MTERGQTTKDDGGQMKEVLPTSARPSSVICSPSSASGPPSAPRSRGRRPRTGNKPSAKRHEQRARQRRLCLIDEVDGLSDHIAGHLLVEGAQRRVVRWLLLCAAPVPPMFAHRYHEGIIGSRCNSRSRHVDRRIDLVGDGPQRRGGGLGIRYFAHLLHAAPDTGGGKYAPIPPSGQMRGNHGLEPMRSTLDLAVDFRFVTQG